ncbi:YqeG family HAD IIIA-type phosphatase [Ruminiclostridium herbifermentans]|uniref:YqeG family HAD IIIA-type phosphatase n=1 Tax=Ruminiclostridium herbifermentans TaxID=2488810 RepID=A0A4U7JK53_9FIRM|nr:YqeG family HAD IIIA-type phosphatase [Ruminiclostridium herbifermentans]QNU65404.1 YqeG family HAD IIIA-type phosphatase [Ruminiclostridium herbifermentans]
MIEKYYPDLYYDSIRHIDLENLKNRGIQGLILDIDNTLVPMHAKDADENAISWIAELKNKGFKVCILSNASEKRVIRFNKDISVTAIHRAYKPSGKAFLNAAKVMGLEPEKVAVIGDQVFTDIIGGNKVNMLTVLVKPIDEKEILFVRFKRIFEKLIIKSFTENVEDKINKRLDKRIEWKKNSLELEKSRFKG